MRITSLLLLVLLCPNVGHAEPASATAPPVTATTPASATELARQARELLEQGFASPAVTLLKQGIGQHPAATELRWLLVRAYLADGNEFWALRTLMALAEQTPGDCEPQLWTAWLQLRQGALAEAQESLAATSCPAGTPSATRQALLLAQVQQHAATPDQARLQLAQARRADRIHPEDQLLLTRLTAELEPGALPPLTGKAELAAGWTSNARAGSPTDPAAQDVDEASPAGQLNLWLRLVAPTGRWVRPGLETEARSLGYTTETGRALSYLLLGLRPGLLLGDRAPVLLAYRFDSLLLAGGDRYADGPLWFHQGHRVEFELNLPANLSLFGGGGRRSFRELGRSRWEADGGLGGSLLPHPRFRLLGALTGRWQEADKTPYDLRGVSLLASAEVRLPGDWALRGGILGGFDAYPHSSGYFDEAEPTTARQDLLLKLSASGFSPTRRGAKLGVTYEYAERFSTTLPYDYQDHRLLLKLTWNFTVDPWSPRATESPGHVALDHGGPAGGFDERLQDLLRQDEAMQRGSSCVE